MTVVAAWPLHVEVCGLCDQLEFWRQIMKNTIQRLDNPPTALSDSHSVSLLEGIVEKYLEYVDVYDRCVQSQN